MPVLVLTAQDSVDYKVDALRAGADDYVTKPFAFEELLARIEALSRARDSSRPARCGGRPRARPRCA
jgi:DNA-binding response OmpR family regulator